jgi:hypothetical protein
MTNSRCNLDIADDLPKELINAICNGYEPAGMKVTKEPEREVESAEYGACRLSLSGYNIAFRVAKTTPTKIGQFVTVWKSLYTGAPIIPLDSEDKIDFLIVNVFDATHQGQFVFNRKTLLERSIFSDQGQGGKLSFRIYPPWIHPVADAAIKTQRWQVPHFFSLTPGSTTDLSQIRRLFV